MAQNLFEWGQAEGREDMFNDMFKKEFIEVAGMRVHCQLWKMRINPYPDAILR